MKKNVHRKYILSILFLGCTFIFGINSIYQAKASTVVDNFFSSMEEKIDSLESKQYYDIGYIKATYSDTNPSEEYGGVWKLIGQGKTLLGMSSDYTVRETGGEKEVTLTNDSIPSHTHTGTTSTNGNHSHSFAARPGLPNPSNADKTVFHFITTENNQGLATKASGPLLKGGYASIGSGGGHNHSFTTNSTGGSQAHNNMQPYITVYYWEKTANSSVSSQNSTGSSQEKLISLTKRLYSIKEGKNYHKIGDIISLTTKYDPNNTESFGGTWVRTAKGKTLVGVDTSDADFSSVKSTGGEKTHTLTIEEMPSHTHTGTVSSTSAHTHSYNRSGSNLFETIFHTTSGNPIYSNNPYDGNCSGLYNQELYAYAAPAGNHSHTFTTDQTGAGQGHSNLMPYYTVYMWEKISDDSGAPVITEISTPSSLSVNQSTTLSAECSDNNGITFKWTYKKEGSTSETVISNYSANIKTSFTPVQSGKYVITLYAKNASGAVSQQSKTVYVQKQQFKLSAVTLTPFKDDAGSTFIALHPVDITPQVSGTTTNLQYQYSYKIGTGSEVILKAYSSSKSATFTPYNSGNITFIVKAKDSEGNIQTVSKTEDFGWWQGLITVSDITPNGYKVTYKVMPPSGLTITGMRFPTWTDKNGQDDLVWHNGDTFVKNSDGSYTGTVYIDRHNHKNEVGTYTTHCYLYADTTYSIAVNPKVELPSTIQNISITDVDSTGYTVTATAITNKSITKAQIPTWTDTNGQDDLIWHNMTVKNNNDGTYTLSYRVKPSEHKNETNVTYQSHIYVYDGSDARLNIDSNEAIPNLSIFVPNSSNLIKEATLLPTGTGYKVTYKINYSGSITAKLPTWKGNDSTNFPTSSSSWPSADSIVNNNDGTYTITFTVNKKDYANASGMYNTHLYLYNSSGTQIAKHEFKTCVPYIGK